MLGAMRAKPDDLNEFRYGENGVAEIRRMASAVR